jgi:FtsZ-binding cell division protein ZapB
MEKDNVDEKNNDLPSAVDDAADAMSKYKKKKDRAKSESKKFKFPPIDYERPPHY